jgi:C4-dicarboxylate-binding protein DctP
MRQIKLVLLSLAAVLLAVAPALAAPVVIKFSHVVAVDTPKGQAAEYFKKLVEERSKGDIKVEVYPNSSLYGDREELEALTMNSIQMVAKSFSKFTSFVPQLELFDLPFLFNDTAHLHKVLNGEVGQQLLGMVGKKGWVGLGYWDNGFKQMSANKPLIKPEDAAGLKFRIMSSKVLEAQFQALNANPQVMPFSEVYSGLQQKVVDACENPLSNFYTQKFFEVQSDLTLTNHGYLGYMVVTNKIFWNKLSEPQRALLTQAMKEASEYANKLALEMDVKYMNEIKASGKTKVHELTKEQRQPWKAKLMPIYPKFYDKIGKELIDASLAAGN